MKIGILTQPLHTNYGGLLQNYALQQTLIRAGHDVETIDWKNPDMKVTDWFRFKRFLLLKFGGKQYKSLKYIPAKKERSVIQNNTNRFIQTKIRHTKAMTGYDDFEVQARNGAYDAYIVGSDQCWRPKYNKFLPAMFLGFLKDSGARRIAYGVSFGTDEWEFSEEMSTICAPLARKFNLVSVREDSGIILCKEHFGVDAIQVLDPTLLLTKEDYLHLVESENEPHSSGTLFNYILDPDDKTTDIINHVAHGLGLKAFQVLPKYQADTLTKEIVKGCIDDCVFPSVTAWLRAFIDAEMTIVDSFHGMVFSILFNKPFWVIGNSERGMSRFTSLLKLFNLENRLLDLNELDNVAFSSPIDWDNVNAILEKQRISSKNLLLNSLK